MLKHFKVEFSSLCSRPRDQIMEIYFTSLFHYFIRPRTCVFDLARMVLKVLTSSTLEYRLILIMSLKFD